MKRINWGRGFFRAWLVASLLWIAFWACITRPDQDAYQLSRFVRGIWAADADLAQTGNVIDGRTREEIISIRERLVTGRLGWWNELLAALILTLSFPVGSYVAARTVAWIGRGFSLAEERVGATPKGPLDPMPAAGSGPFVLGLQERPGRP